MMQTLEKYIHPLHVLLLLSIFKNNSKVQQLQELWKKSTFKIKKVSAADLLRAVVALRQVPVFQKEIWPPAALSREGGIHKKIMLFLKLQLILPRKHRLDWEKYAFIPNGAVCWTEHGWLAVFILFS